MPEEACGFANAAGALYGQIGAEVSVDDMGEVAELDEHYVEPAALESVGQRGQADKHEKCSGVEVGKNGDIDITVRPSSRCAGIRRIVVFAAIGDDNTAIILQHADSEQRAILDTGSIITLLSFLTALCRDM